MAGELGRFFCGDEARREIARDQHGRPLIQQTSGAIIPYTRASSLGKALDDETGLTRWKQRLTAIGLASRSDLVLAVNAHRADKDKIDDLVEQAMRAAQSDAAAITGTALHDLCDQYDHGRSPYVPSEYQPDVRAYLDASVRLEVVVAERFAVCDELRVGGTPDRVYRLRAPLVVDRVELVSAGELIIGDIKTGASLRFGHLSYSVQLAVYARSQRYDISAGLMAPWGRRGETVPVGTRHDWVPGEKVNTSWGVIVHLPAGGGQVHDDTPVDLTIGWELAHLATTIRAWRTRKNIIGARVTLGAEDFHTLCARAESHEELLELYQRALVVGAWNDVLRQAFTRRRVTLETTQAGATR